MEDTLLKKRYFAKTKKNKTKQKNKTWKEKSQVVAIQYLAGLIAIFYFYHINLIWLFFDIFSDGVNAQTWKEKYSSHQ